MVTYEGLIQFVIMITYIVTLVVTALNNKPKK